MPEWTTSTPRRVQPVDHPADVRLVPRDRVRREDHGVLGPELEPPVLARRHQGEGRQRLTLAARADDAHLGGIAVAEVLDVDERVVGDVEQPHLPGEAHVLPHRQAEGGDDPAPLDGRVADLLDAVEVAGEAGDDEATPGVGVEQVGEHLPDRPLRRRVPGLLGVGRVTEQEPDAVARRRWRRCGRGR